MFPDGWSQLPCGVDVFTRNGSAGKPVALATGGIHGDEYEGPAAVVEIIEKLPELEVAGTVVAIPVANPGAWRASQRVSPDDGLNLARTFPGNHSGSATERLAACLFEVAERADYLIDLHSGGVEYLFQPLCGFYGDPTPANPSFAAARRFGLPLQWKLPATDGVLSCELWKRGHAVVGCEYLGAGQLSRDGIDQYVRGALSCLSHWGMLSDTFLLPEAGRLCVGDWLLAEAEGLFYASCQLGDAVRPGQTLATIRTHRGEVRQSFQSSEHGFVLAIRSKAYIREGNWGVLIARDL